MGPVRHLFLINLHAGKYDRIQEMREKLRTASAGQDRLWEAVVTQYPGHGAGLARVATERGEPVRVYAYGGDGTLSEATTEATGLGNTAAIHCLMGPGNDFLWMSGSNVCRFYDLRALLDTPQAPVNLVECNGRLALNVCSVGFDARISLGAADFRKLPLVNGPLAHQPSVVRTIIQGVHRPYRVTIDGERLLGEAFTLICACNGCYYGGGFNLCPSAVPDDGLLDFVTVLTISRLTIPTLIDEYIKGGAGDIPRILLRRDREMHVVCERTDRINLDGGEPVDFELSARVSAKRIDFFFLKGTRRIPEGRVRNQEAKENGREKKI